MSAESKTEKSRRGTELKVGFVAFWWTEIVRLHSRVLLERTCLMDETIVFCYVNIAACLSL